MHLPILRGPDARDAAGEGGEEVTPTLSDFLEMQVVRDGATARIVFGHDQQGRPIHLFGFTADADLTDFEVCEEGLRHYEGLRELLA